MENEDILEEIPSRWHDFILNGIAALEDARLKLAIIADACFFNRMIGFNLAIINTSTQ